MAKSPKKLVSFRLPVEVVFSIQEMADVLSVSQSDVVEQAVVFFETHQGSGDPRVVMSYPSPIAAVQSSSDLQAMIDKAQGHKSQVGSFPCRCIHAGCRGAKFMGASRYANLCSTCQELGHTGDPRSCEECLLVQGAL